MIAAPPIVHVLAGRRRGRGSGRLAHDADDLGAALRYLADEVSVEPGRVANDIPDARVSNLAEVRVRVLCRRVVAPNDDIADVVRVNLLTGLRRDLAEGTRLIQPRHGGELLLRDAGSV